MRLHIDNSAEGFFPRSAAALQDFQRLELDYGRDRAVRLVLQGEDLWTVEGLGRLAEIEAAAADPRRVGGGVYAVAGLLRHHGWHLDDPLPDDPQAFRELAIADPVNRNAGFLSHDGGIVTVLVGLLRMDPERQTTTLRRLEALLPPSSSVSGLPVIIQTIDGALVEMVRRLFPLLFAVALVVLLALFPPTRSGRVTFLLPLALVAACQTVLFGALGYAGQRLDVVTITLAPLLFVISLATGAHVLAYHRRVQAAHPELPSERVVQATYQVKAWPVLWTGLTTCAAFGSLAVAETPPVRMLGLWAAFGLAFLTVAALSFYPALLVLVGARRDSAWPRRQRLIEVETEEPLARLAGLGGACARWAVAHRRLVLWLFASVALVAALGLPRLTPEANLLDYLRPDHPVRAAVQELEDSGIGVASASLTLELPQRGAADQPETLRRLAALAAEIRREPLVLGVLSAGDVVANVARYDAMGDLASEATGASDAELAAARSRIDRLPDQARLLGAMRAADGQRTRIIFFTRLLGYAGLAPLYARVEELGGRSIPEAEAHVTGLHPMIQLAQQNALRTMVLSLILTLLVIVVTLWRLLRSSSLTVRVLAANLWPVLLVLGAVGWLRTPVEGAIVMIGAIVLGLAVDDTLHTLGHLRRTADRTSRGSTPDEIAVTALAETAPGHLASGLVLAFGFATLVLSSLVPVARFGPLAALGVLGALAADMLLVPALLAGAPASAVARLRGER